MRETAARSLGEQKKPYLVLDMLLEMLRSGGNAEGDWRRRCWVLDRFDATCNDPRVLAAITQYLPMDPSDAIGGGIPTDHAAKKRGEGLGSKGREPGRYILLKRNHSECFFSSWDVWCICAIVSGHAPEGVAPGCLRVVIRKD